MQLHQISTKTKRSRSRQVGRGGKRGKTSGRGTKGQKSRSGHRMRPQARDEIKKIPKLRGRGKNVNTSIKAKPAVVNLVVLEKVFATGDVVSPKTLAEKKLVRVKASVKILGTGEITKKLVFENCTISATAKEKIVAVGGTIKE